MEDPIRRIWLIGLTVAVSGLYGWIGLTAGGLVRTLGLAGSLLILVALVATWRSRGAAGVLLVVGAVPLAIATWWSILTPMLAALALVLGGLATQRTIRVVPPGDRRGH